MQQSIYSFDDKISKMLVDICKLKKPKYPKLFIKEFGKYDDKSYIINYILGGMFEDKYNLAIKDIKKWYEKRLLFEVFIKILIKHVPKLKNNDYYKNIKKERPFKAFYFTYTSQKLRQKRIGKLLYDFDSKTMVDDRLYKIQQEILYEKPK